VEAKHCNSLFVVVLSLSLYLSLSHTHTKKQESEFFEWKTKAISSSLLLLHYLFFFFFFFFSKQSGVERLCSWKDLIENNDEHFGTRFVVVVAGIGYDLVA
jgi:hypothetical protein